MTEFSGGRDEALVFRLPCRIAYPTQKGSVGVETILNICEICILRKFKIMPLKSFTVSGV